MIHQLKLITVTFFVMWVIGMIPVLGQFQSFEVSPEEQREILKGYIMLALENNAGINASRIQAESAGLQSRQFGSLMNPMLEFEYDVWSRMSPEDRMRLSIMQPIPWFGSLTATRSYYDQLAEAQRHQVTEEENALIYNVRTLWYEMHEMIHHIYVYFETIELLESLEEQILSRLGTGQGSQVDALRIQMEIARYKSMIDSSEDELSSLQKEFNSLLNRDLNARINLLYEFDPEPVPDFSELVSQIEENPGLLVLDRAADAARTDIRRAQLEGRPGFELGVGVMNRDLLIGDPGRVNTVELMMRMDLPIYRGKYRAREQRARLESQFVSETRANAEITLESELEVAKRQLRTAIRDQELYMENLLPMAEQALEIALSSYSFRGDGFEQIIQLQRQIIDFWMMYYTSITEHNNAVARIEYVTGRTLYKEIEL